VIVAAIKSPAMIVRKDVPSCVRTIVNVSATMAVTRTISALFGSGRTPAGQTETLKGGTGNRAPWPDVTTTLVAVADTTYDTAKFL
jgi:hypothetical protein